MRNVVTVALLAVLLPGAVNTAAATQRFVDVREVVADTLRDVAVTVVANGRPTIYFNPALMQELGPGLSAFAMAHEYGHVRYGHTGGALGDPAGTDAELRIRHELEADCYAARILGETNPTAVTAAVQFFNRMGPFRFDRVHPAGAQRSAMINACLPKEESPATSGATSMPR